MLCEMNPHYFAYKQLCLLNMWSREKLKGAHTERDDASRGSHGGGMVRLGGILGFVVGNSW